MSMFLIFCVLAAAGWLVLSMTNRDSSDRPDASVAAYSRAMAALSPQHDDHAAPHGTRRPPARAARPRPRPRPRPHGAPRPRRRPSTAPRTTTRR